MMGYLNLVVVADPRQPETLQHIDLICKRIKGREEREVKKRSVILCVIHWVNEKIKRWTENSNQDDSAFCFILQNCIK